MTPPSDTKCNGASPVVDCRIGSRIKVGEVPLDPGSAYEKKTRSNVKLDWS